jgi:hypothetical protein
MTTLQTDRQYSTTFIDNFAEKATNLTRGLSRGRLRAIQAVAQAID